MLLRIIDFSRSAENKNSIRIILEDGIEIANFYIDDFLSPIGKSFRESLVWYFKEYIESPYRTSEAVSLAERLIRYGQVLGDELLGEDHQLTKCKDYIQANKYQNLNVNFESENLNFFNECWEILVLPESKYILSGVANSYTRKWIAKTIVTEFPELRFDLGRFTSEKNSVGIGNKGRLKILHLVSRPELAVLDMVPSNSLNLALEGLCGDLVNYEIASPKDKHHLRQLLTDKNSPVHILHYDGPVFLGNDSASIALGDAMGAVHLLGMDELSDYLIEQKIGAICLDACVYIKDNTQVSASEGLAIFALIAHKHGFGNIIGLAQVTNSWVSSQCYKTLYSQIARGCNLGQAVVEVRKILQSSTESDLTSVRPVPFISWPLIIHYSQQIVDFFESPQSQASFGDIQSMTSFKRKLFGFRSAMLPPLWNHPGDGFAPQIISHLAFHRKLNEGQCISITGESGIGKTMLMHMVALYLSEKQCIDYGFYFSYADDNYTVTDIYRMIAPVLDIAVDQVATAKNKLFSLHCLFIFDDIQTISLDEQLALREFIQELIAGGHNVIIGNPSLQFLDLIHYKISMLPLSLFEQKILYTKIVRRLSIPDSLSLDESSYLLNKLQGNPWLIKKTLPIVVDGHVDNIFNQLDIFVDAKIGNQSKVHLFYQWQWNGLAPVWRRLLLLCSNVPGLLMEMIMAAADSQSSQSHYEDFFYCLGDKDIKVEAGLLILERAGFLTKLPHGRVIDYKCLPFLNEMRSECFFNLDMHYIDTKFSQLICEGIGILSRHIIKKPNAAIYDNLLINRRGWVKHFESLWFNKQYKEFFSVKFSFEQLMHQAHLSNEMKIWIASLLDRSPVSNMECKLGVEEQLAWVALASEVANDIDMKNHDFIQQGVSIWSTWLDEFMVSKNANQLALFHQVLIFLDRVYKAANNFSACISIHEQAFPIYKEYKAWNKAIHSLKSLIGYYLKLDDMEQALSVEKIMLDDISYTESPPGYQLQQIIDVLLLHVARKDLVRSQELLHRATLLDIGGQFKEVLNGVQCDIDYLSGNYLAALRHYCTLWVQALGTEQVTHIKSLQQRMIELAHHVGVESFKEVFDQEVPAGTLSPVEYSRVVH